MRALETRLFTILGGDATLAALLPGGVHRRRVPVGTALPYLVFAKEAPGGPQVSYTLRSEVMQRFTYLFRAVCEGTDEGPAVDALERVKVLLQDAELGVTGYETGYCREVGPDFELVDSDEAGNVRNHVGKRFRIDLMRA